MADQLDRGDIVREIVNAKVPFMSEEFYRREAKMKRKQPLFRMKFDDLIEAVSERAAILKAQGKTSKTQGTGNSAKIASSKTSGNQQQYNNVVKNSPPKQQPDLPVKPKCQWCKLEHRTEECSQVLALTVEKRQEEFRKRALCFKCLTQGHIGKFCPNEQPVCKHCKKNHLSILHVDYEKNQKDDNKAAETATLGNPESANKKA